MFAPLLFVFAQLATVAFAAPAPVLEARQSISTLTAAQVASYKPYTYYASTAYCAPARTLAWNCGANCNANPGFTTIASGGDGASTQYWFVGYDASLKTIIVSYQGTDASKILPVITNINFDLQPLRPALFPGVGSAPKTHDGFGDAHARSAAAVLAAVRTGITRFGATMVTLTGHSLGGALAVVATAQMAANLPSNISLRTITYGAPRVGNQAFVDYVNSRAVMNRIVNQDDPVPILPGRFVGFDHTEGEIHILNSNAWVNCPGQDNTNSQCTIGYVPNVLAGDPGDHSGPFDGVNMGC
jgi:hypothetical protein